MKWKHRIPTPPRPGEIDPARLLGWFQDTVDRMDVPEEAWEYIGKFDEIAVQQLLTFGSEMLPADWPHESDLDVYPNADEIRRILDRAADVIGSKICNFSGWQHERITKVSWNAEQYNALRKGYLPDWDMRYATFHRRGNFYVYRSGHILKKFHVMRGADGFWHITSQYTTAKEGMELLMNEVITCGYWETPLLNRR